MSRWVNAVHLREYLEVNQAVAKHIDRRKFFGWSMGLALPFTIAMGFFVQWHNGVVGQVRPVHVLLRGAICMIGYGIIMVVVYCKALRPALKKAQEESESRSQKGNDV